MIVNICGCMGQGKSEMISLLKEEGYQVETLLSSENRPKTLDEFCEVQENLLFFRRKLMEEHREDNPEEILIIESSFIEMFVYSLFVVGVNTEYGKWLDEYYYECMELQREVDVVVNMPPNKEVSLSKTVAKSFRILTGKYQNIIDSDENEVIDLRSDLSIEELGDSLSKELNKIRNEDLS